MTDPAERFIEAAVRPLADNAEMQILAAQELRTAIEEAPERTDSDSLDQAAENLEKGGLPRWFKVALYSLTALATILVAIPLARDYQHYRLATYTLFGMSDPDVVALPGFPFGPEASRKTPDILGSFSHADELLLFGDLSTPSGFPDHFKGLWDSDPASAAFFAEYTRASSSSPPALPAKFFETADRLDPENGWFQCFAAGLAALDAVQKNPAIPRIRKTGPPLPAYVVKNPAKLAEVMTLLDEAARMPRFDSYERELFLRRIAILPPGDDTFGRLFAEKYLEMWPRRSRWIYRHIAQAVTVKCQELALAGDSSGFLKVTESWESFVRRSIENPSLPPDEALWTLSGFAQAATELKISASTLGLTEKADRYQRLVDQLELRKIIASNNRSSEAKELLSHAGPDARRLISARARLENPPPLTEADLRPGLMANSAKRERLKSAMMGTIILLAALHLAGLRFYRGPQVRRLSASLVRVLRWDDYGWILIGGVILPVLALVLTEPIEAKSFLGIDWELDLPRIVLQAGLLLALPAIITSLRLERRLGCLGKKVLRMTTPIAVGLGVAMVLISRLGFPDIENNVLWAGALVWLAPFAICYLFLPLAASLGARKTAIYWHTCCRALIPAHILSVLLMALLVPFHHAREKQWTARNLLTKIEPGIPAMNRYEYEIANQERRDLLELLDAKP